MSDIFKKEFASAIKWLVVITVAAIAYYEVTPKYYLSRSGGRVFRLNQVTGDIYESYELNEVGKLIFEWPKPIKKIAVKNNPEKAQSIEDIFDEMDLDDQIKDEQIDDDLEGRKYSR